MFKYELIILIILGLVVTGVVFVIKTLFGVIKQKKEIKELKQKVEELSSLNSANKE